MLLLIAALPREFAGVTPRARLASADARWLASVRLSHGDALLAANGIGQTAAGDATRRLVASHPVEAVVSTGFAGALHPDLRPGEIFVARSVAHGDTVYPCSIPVRTPDGSRKGIVRTVDRVVVTAREKLDLGRKGAGAVDMEAGAVAQVAAEAALPFYCLKAISDSVERDLPVDFNLALKPDGSLSLPAVARLATGVGGAWPGMWRLWRDARHAARSLGHCLDLCRFPG